MNSFAPNFFWFVWHMYSELKVTSPCYHSFINGNIFTRGVKFLKLFVKAINTYTLHSLKIGSYLSCPLGTWLSLLFRWNNDVINMKSCYLSLCFQRVEFLALHICSNNPECLDVVKVLFLSRYLWSVSCHQDQHQPSSGNKIVASGFFLAAS